jgi:hypothetical protein
MSGKHRLQVQKDSKSSVLPLVASSSPVVGGRKPLVQAVICGCQFQPPVQPAPETRSRKGKRILEEYENGTVQKRSTGLGTV